MAAKTQRKLRRSQAISTFGPGAIVDLSDESVMMMGIDFWRVNASEQIQEPNLERLLHVDHFRSPGSDDGNTFGSAPSPLPIRRFPEWLVCSGCRRLAHISDFISNLERDDDRLRCPACRKPLHPARLVVTCRRGHISDFPWVWWAHRGSTSCDRPRLTLSALGRTAALSDLIVSCHCGASASLGGAMERRNFANRPCKGERPWLGEERERDCQEEVVPIQRGASNVYFPAMASAITIPPWSSPLQTGLNQHWASLRGVDEANLPGLISGMNLPEKLGHPADRILRAVKDRLLQDSADRGEINETGLRYLESQALRQASDPDHDEGIGDFDSRPTAVHPRLTGHLALVNRITRLREVRALMGFSRLDSADPSTRRRGDLAPLSAVEQDWLPATEVRGEGIYIELSPERIASWEQTHEPLRQRIARLERNYQAMCLRRSWQVSRRITPGFVLTHSFSHALMRQLSLESGYSSAAIRERLYVFGPQEGQDEYPARYGVLIYTSSADSEGSLGGLMRQGQPDRLYPSVLAAIADASWCSSDPLCIESEAQGADGMNLAACHACLLLSETSCEEFNRLLDRALLTGTPGHPAIGYFNELLD